MPIKNKILNQLILKIKIKFLHKKPFLMEKWAVLGGREVEKHNLIQDLNSMIQN